MDMTHGDLKEKKKKKQKRTNGRNRSVKQPGTKQTRRQKPREIPEKQMLKQIR